MYVTMNYPKKLKKGISIYHWEKDCIKQLETSCKQNKSWYLPPMDSLLICKSCRLSVIGHWSWIPISTSWEDLQQEPCAWKDFKQNPAMSQQGTEMCQPHKQHHLTEKPTKQSLSDITQFWHRKSNCHLKTISRDDSDEWWDKKFYHAVHRKRTYKPKHEEILIVGPWFPFNHPYHSKSFSVFSTSTMRVLESIHPHLS